jgi:hypothetical protein
LADAVGIGEVTMGKVMQIDENAPEVIKEAPDISCCAVRPKSAG